MPPRDKDGNYTEFEPKIMIRDPETGGTFEFQATALDDGLTPRRGPDDGLILPGAGEEATFTIRLPRMSRKKFIKKMMSLGYSRNFARIVADGCWKTRIPYGNMYSIGIMNMLSCRAIY